MNLLVMVELGYTLNLTFLGPMYLSECGGGGGLVGLEVGLFGNKGNLTSFELALGVVEISTIFFLSQTLKK